MRGFFLKLWRRKRMERDLEAELAFHHEMAAAKGNPIPLGNTSVLKEEAFDMWRFTAIENLWRDLRFAMRGLRRSPGFVASALLSLALGIGVNMTMFSIAVEFLLSQPSVRDPATLAQARIGNSSHSSQEAVDLIRRTGVFADVAGEKPQSSINWNDGQETRRLFALQGSKNYFDLLGVPLALGRGWNERDTDEVAVLRYGFWKSKLGGDPLIVGRLIQLDGRAYTVIGVLPEGHRTLVGYGYSPDLYIPVMKHSTELAILLRLKPEMGFAAAHSALAAMAERMDRQMPDYGRKYAEGVRVTPVEGMARLKTERTAMTVGMFFVALLVLVGLVLMIACINVAGLLLARSAARKQEIAIRLSLGASRGRLLQQLLAESLLLSVSGAALGFVFALFAAQTMAAISLPVPFPIHLRIEPDWRVACYAAILAVFSAMISGLMPAWQAVRESLSSDLRRERRMHSRKALVAAQIALSFLVLAVGALFTQNLLRSRELGLGFDLRNTLMAEAYLAPSNYADDAQIKLYWRRAVAALEALPGVEAAAGAQVIPFTDSISHGGQLTFVDNGEKVSYHTNWNAVTPGYFAAMGISVLQGATFNGVEAGEVMVNEAFVRSYLGGRVPLGTMFQRKGHAAQHIVAVVRGTKNMTLGEGDLPQMYEPLEQREEQSGRMMFVVKTVLPPASQVAAVRAALRQLDPAVGLEVSTLFGAIGLAFLPSQVGAGLMGCIAVLGLLLAAIGLYGILAFTIARRTREIGIRLALGASRAGIGAMVLRETAMLVAVGAAVGLGLSVLVAKPLAAFVIPGISATNPLSLAAVFAVMAVTALLATIAPLRRAVGIEPSQCLRLD